MRALITGINGFVGTHLSNYLISNGWQVTGMDRTGRPVSNEAWIRDLYSDSANAKIKVVTSDMTSQDELEKILTETPVDVIFHLAGTAFVPDAWSRTSEAVENNGVVPIRLFQAARAVKFSGKIVFASSAEVYGFDQPMPLTERSIVAPANPYAQSKRVAEEFVPFFKEVSIVIARPFNHVGPGQRENFVIPSFLKRIADAKASGENSIPVGDLSASRDFTDIRDVVRAYELLGKNGIAGETYNICSGKAIAIQKVLDCILQVTGSQIKPVVDPALLRPDVTSIRYGSADRIKKLGWDVKVPLEKTISDTWRAMQQMQNQMPQTNT